MKQVTELIRYLPEFLQGFREYQVLFGAENPEFVLLHETADALLDNGFIRTANLQGLRRWEQLLGIPVSGKDLVERRAAILGKWNRSLPYTMARLYEYLDVLAARDEYHILLSPTDYRFELVTENLPSGVLRAMRDLVREMLPANMLFILADRIPGEAALLLALQAHIRITGAFYPRSNIPPRYLDGATRLDGRYPLNGYLSGKSIDFYPLALQVGCGAGEYEWVSADGETGVCGDAAELVGTGAAMLVRGAGEVEACPVGTLQMNCAAGEAGGTAAAGYLRVEKNWKTLDGSKTLNGGRALNAEAYEVEM